jgi:hypothetical protein
MFAAPPMPTFPTDQAGTTEELLRYEDVTQDGFLIPIAIPPAMSGLWHTTLREHVGHRNALRQGVIAILTRLTVASLEQPIRVDRPVQSYSGFELARDGDGDNLRLFMNTWAEIRGAAGKISGRPPGPPALAGRLFSEHTFTRPFAPPDQRRVTRLEVEGFPEIPETRYAAPAPKTAMDAPDGARWLDELAPDPCDLVFTLDQTDSNQHVNSLVYVRYVLDAAQRRIAALGRPWKIRSRAVDIAYRKPCFAGDRAAIQLRLFEHPDGIGAAGFVAAPGEEAKPRCYVRVLFS